MNSTQVVVLSVVTVKELLQALKSKAYKDVHVFDIVFVFLQSQLISVPKQTYLMA